MSGPRATLYRFGQPRLGAAGLLGAATIAALALLAAALLGEPGDRPPLSAAVLLGGFVLAGWWLFGVVAAIDLRLDGDELVARTLLRTRRIPVTAIEAVGPSRLGPAIVHVRHAGGVVRTLSAVRGLDGLAEALQRRRPEIAVDLPDLLDAVDRRRDEDE